MFAVTAGLAGCNSMVGGDAEVADFFDRDRELAVGRDALSQPGWYGVIRSADGAVLASGDHHRGADQYH